jgi:hypothetical protein
VIDDPGRYLGERWPSRLVATAEEDHLNFRRNLCERPGAARWRAERLLGYSIAGERLHPKAQPRELSVDNPQLVFRVGFVLFLATNVGNCCGLR